MADPGPRFPHDLEVEPFRIDAHDALQSTNDRARELAAEGAEDVVVVADRQTAGRGRLDRTWASPSGGIWMSLLLRPDLPVEQVPLLTFGAAVAVVDAADRLNVRAGIKWPNDVLVGDEGEERKLSGILTESSTADDGLEWAIIGVGINANVDIADLPPGSVTLSHLVGEVDRSDLTRDVLETFAELRADPDRILAGWRRRAITLGQRVSISTGEKTVTGRALDIDDTGRLLVDTSDGIVHVATGECDHLRPA